MFVVCGLLFQTVHAKGTFKAEEKYINKLAIALLGRNKALL